MKQILHVTCSPRGDHAESSKLSRKIVGHLLDREPAATVVTRDLGRAAPPHIDEAYAFSQQASEDLSQEGSMARAEELVRELERADFLVIGTPVHNYTVPSALKAWIDHVARVRRTFDVTPAGKVALLRDRPVFIAVASGGRFSGDRTRQPDFLTPYLRAILGMIGLHDLSFFSVEGTVAGEVALAEARLKADEALQRHFSALA